MGEFTYLEPQDGPAPDASLASLLCALSFASGLALGDRMEHGIGTAYIGLRLADAVRLADHEREAVYYGALLKDAGCTACFAVRSPFSGRSSAATERNGGARPQPTGRGAGLAVDRHRDRHVTAYPRRENAGAPGAVRPGAEASRYNPLRGGRALRPTTGVRRACPVSREIPARALGWQGPRLRAEDQPGAGRSAHPVTTRHRRSI